MSSRSAAAGRRSASGRKAAAEPAGREPAYLALSQVAMRTGRHPELLRQWCASGRLPCQRIGGSWAILERDLPLVDGIASRRRERQPAARATARPRSTGRSRVVVAAFDDRTMAQTAVTAVRDRLGLDADAIGSRPVEMTPVAVLALTLVACRVPRESVLDARRLLAGYGGRIVADIEEAAASGRGGATGRRRRSTTAASAGKRS